MLISLSKPNESGKRHVVLVCEGNDITKAGPVIAAVLGDKVRPVRRWNPHTRQYRYLFNSSYLDTLLLAFPNAQKSTGLQRRLDRIHSKEMETREIAPFKIPGLWDRKNDKAIRPYNFQYTAIHDIVQYMSGDNDDKYIEHFLENDEMGLGKAEKFDEPVLTPEGWTAIGQLKVGDLVIGRDGNPTPVIGVFPQGKKAIYRVTFSDGSWTDCTYEHLWNVQTPNDRFRRPDHWRTMTTAQILEAGLHRDNGNRMWWIPMCEPVQYPEANIPIDPYVLGAFLGDGTFSACVLAGIDEFIHQEVMRLTNGISFTAINGGWRYRGTVCGDNPLRSAWRELGLINCVRDQKHIPIEYMHGSVAQRIALIQGLLDTDGECRPDNAVQFSNISETLIDQLRELVESLGGTAKKNIKHARCKRPDGSYAERDGWVLTIALPPGIMPFRLPRKADAYRDRPKYQPNRAIESIEYIDDDEAVCILVDNPEHLYLTRHHIVTHNTLIALSAILVLKHRYYRSKKLNILVIAPKNGKFVWERENSRFADLDLVVIDSDRMTPIKRDLAISSRPEITVINPEMLRGAVGFEGKQRVWKPKYPDLFNFMYDIAIIDEYHRFGSPTSQQTQGLMHLQSERWLPMSGTPYMNRPEQLWPVLNRCWPEVFPDYDHYERSIQIIDKPTGKPAGYHPIIMREIKEFLEPRSIRRRKDQVLKDLPKKQIIRVPIELTKEQRKLYNKVKDELLIVLESGQTKKITSILAHITRLKQACFSPELYGGSKHSAKIAELHTIVESLVDSGEKAIIGSEWSKATKILMREFEKYNPAYVDGSVTGDARMKQADRFNDDPSCHLYIGTIGANREAVSLGAATHVILTDKDWSPFINDQFIARSAAGGLRGLNSTVESVTVLDLFGADTYEERVEEINADKRNTFNAFVENDGGEKVQRTVLGSIRDLI